MGNQNAKNNTNSLFTADELRIIEASFRAISGHSNLTREKLLESWFHIVDEHLARCTVNFLYETQRKRALQITHQRYGEPFYIVERGTIDEQVAFMACGLEKLDEFHYSLKELETYVTSVIRSYLKIHLDDAEKTPFNDWKTIGCKSAERTILALSKGLTRSVTNASDNCFNLNQLENWLQMSIIFKFMWQDVFTHLYNKNLSKSQKLDNNCEHILVPKIENITIATTQTHPILDIPQVIFINQNLPNEFRHKWRFLFSSKIMGQSFSTMLGKIINQGPTLLVVEDEDRYVFAGYAPISWALRPVFVGDDTSMLFTLSPALRGFSATGYNDHYQYLNINQQTMPNGLGMGGQFEYWGLWLDREYGIGQCSESCTTYRDYKQLSKRKEFRVRNIEVWGIGDVPKNEDDDDDDAGGGDAASKKQRSVLDKNLEDRVMLELSGRQIHSAGLRESPPPSD